MKLEIEITRQDYIDFNTFHFMKTQLKRTILSAVLVVVVLQYFLNREEMSIPVIVISSAVSFLIYFFIIRIGIKRTGRIPKDDGSILGKRTLELREEGIYCVTNNSDSKHNWNTAKSIETGKTAYYLYVDANMAFMIPKRYLGNEKEQDFLKLVHSKLNNQK